MCQLFSFFPFLRAAVFVLVQTFAAKLLARTADVLLGLPIGCWVLSKLWRCRNALHTITDTATHNYTHLERLGNLRGVYDSEVCAQVHKVRCVTGRVELDPARVGSMSGNKQEVTYHVCGL